MKMARILAAMTAALLSSTAMAANDGIPNTPTIQSGVAYSSGNAMGAGTTGNSALQTIPAFRSAYLSPSGVLDGVSASWAGGWTVPVTEYIFDTMPTATTCNDKQAFALGAADIPKLAIAPFTLTPAATTGTTITSVQSSFQAVSVKNQDGTPARVFYVCHVVGGSVTPASASDLTVKYMMSLD